MAKVLSEADVPKEALPNSEPESKPWLAAISAGKVIHFKRLEDGEVVVDSDKEPKPGDYCMVGYPFISRTNDESRQLYVPESLAGVRLEPVDYIEEYQCAVCIVPAEVKVNAKSSA